MPLATTSIRKTHFARHTYLVALGEESLAHLYAPDGDKYRSVQVDVHQGAALVEHSETERESVLVAGDGQASLLPAVGTVGHIS